MPKIYVKGEFEILGNLLSSEKTIHLDVVIENKRSVQIDINSEEKSIISQEEVEVSVDLFEAMKNGNIGKLPKKLELELSEATKNTHITVRKVLSLLKYCFNQHNIDEQLIASKGDYWSLEGEEWVRIPRHFQMSMAITGLMQLKKENLSTLQEYLRDDFQPILALRHLHRAFNESIPRHKWIDATIAAELAIKEFLIRQKPELSTLLLEVPSPPMHKMYGAILKEYSGKELDKRVFKALVEGAEIRNRLLHKPQDEIIDHQKAIDYVSAVSQAIQYLLSILYPKYHFPM